MKVDALSLSMGYDHQVVFGCIGQVPRAWVLRRGVGVLMSTSRRLTSGALAPSEFLEYDELGYLCGNKP